MESANAYMANTHPDCLHDCIFLVCDNCGQTTHIDDDSIDQDGARRRQGHGLFARAPGDRSARQMRGLRLTALPARRLHAKSTSARFDFPESEE